MRRFKDGAMLPPRTHEETLEYKRQHSRDRREKIKERGKAWRIANRERNNAHQYLQKLRAMKDPLPRHVRKMAFLAAKYPKRRVVYCISQIEE